VGFELLVRMCPRKQSELCLVPMWLLDVEWWVRKSLRKKLVIVKEMMMGLVLSVIMFLLPELVQELKDPS